MPTHLRDHGLKNSTTLTIYVSNLRVLLASITAITSVPPVLLMSVKVVMYGMHLFPFYM
jgi:hypothetical protein